MVFITRMRRPPSGHTQSGFTLYQNHSSGVGKLTGNSQDVVYGDVTHHLFLNIFVHIQCIDGRHALYVVFEFYAHMWIVM